MCSKAEHKPVITVKDAWSDQSFNVVECTHCGMWYTTPRPTAEGIGWYYAQAYYQEIGVTKNEKELFVRKSDFRGRLQSLARVNHFGYPGKRSFLGALASWPAAWFMRHGRYWPARHIPWAGQGRLLDYGFGGCKFMLQQRQVGWQVTGIDFSEDVVNSAKKTHQLEAYVGSWPGPLLADRQFDFVSCWHVIEHVADPHGVVGQIVKQLSPGGYVLIACPNCDSWGRRIFGIDWMPWELPRHFNHFTSRKLVNLLNDAGIGDVDVMFDTQRRTLEKSCRYRAERTGSGFWKWLSRRKMFLSMFNRVACLFGKADIVILIGRKPL